MALLQRWTRISVHVNADHHEVSVAWISVTLVRLVGLLVGHEVEMRHLLLMVLLHRLATEMWGWWTERRAERRLRKTERHQWTGHLLLDMSLKMMTLGRR